MVSNKAIVVLITAGSHEEAALKWNLFKVGHLFESAKTLVNLRVYEALDALRAELFDVKGSHH